MIYKMAATQKRYLDSVVSVYILPWSCRIPSSCHDGVSVISTNENIHSYLTVSVERGRIPIIFH